MKKDLDIILSFTKSNGDCLEWTRCLNTDGYPRAYIDGSANAKVHRVVYEIVKGDIPKGLVIRHTCDNPLCINPDHLIGGRPIDNVQDRVDRGRCYRKVTINIIQRVIELNGTGKLLKKEIAVLVGIDARRVCDIINGKYCSATGKFLGHG